MKQNIIRIMAILLVLSLAAFPVFAEGNGGSAAIAPEGPAQAGETVRLTVSLANMPAYGDLGVEFDYDPSLLELVNGEWLLSGAALMDVDTESGLAVWTGERIGAVNGDVLAVEFQLGENVTSEDAIEVSCNIIAKASGNTVASLTASTFIEVPSYIPGDINGDGKVNNKDLTLLFQYLSGWDVEVNEVALDVNGDGKINNKDLTLLFQYLSGWDVTIY